MAATIFRRLTRQDDTTTVAKVTSAPRQKATTTLRGSMCRVRVKSTLPSRAVSAATMLRLTTMPSATPTSAAPRS